MNKFYLIIISILAPVVVFSQSPGGVSPKAWYKADGTITLSGSTVTQWNNDASGATVHLNTVPSGNGTTTANAAPTYTNTGFNFNPIVTFNGLQGLYNGTAAGSSFVNNNNNSFFIVFSNATSTNGVMAKWEEISTNRISFEKSNTRLRADFPTSSDQVFSTTDVASYGFIGNDLTSSSLDSMLINGVYESVLNISGSVDNSKTGKVLFGSNVDGAYPFTGNISEVIFYDSKIGDFARQKVQSYLALKYGISLGSTSNVVNYLNSSGTIIWTGSATYQNNVTGIGSDVNSGLNQKQSKSTSVNGVITMGLLTAGAGNSLPAANSGNGNSFSADNTFLIWGHNGGSLYGNASDLPSGITRKSARIWKTQLTGTGLASKNIRIVVDLSALTTLSVSDYTNYRLLLDADGTFASGATTVSPVTGNNGSKLVQFDVVMSSYSNYYFTIGTVDNMSAPLPLEFLSFEVKQEEGTTVLNWKTSNEIKCKDFEIEWSHDSEHWFTLGTISANNNGSGINLYSFKDTKSHSGISYYRIKQNDLDGKFTYSSVKVISTVPALMFHISPNPVQDQLEIRNLHEETVQFNLLDLNGVILLKGEIGANDVCSLSVSGFASGLYVLECIANDKVAVQKFEVIK